MLAMVILVYPSIVFIVVIIHTDEIETQMLSERWRRIETTEPRELEAQL